MIEYNSKFKKHIQLFAADIVRNGMGTVVGKYEMAH